MGGFGLKMTINDEYVTIFVRFESGKIKKSHLEYVKKE